MKVSKPKDPLDILWSNLDVSRKQALSRVTLIGLAVALVIVGYFAALMYLQSWRIDNKAPLKDYSKFKSMCQDNCPNTDAEFQVIIDDFYQWIHLNPQLVPLEFRENLHTQQPWLRKILSPHVFDDSHEDFFNLLQPDPELDTYDVLSSRQLAYLLQELHYCSRQSRDLLRSRSYANLVCYRGEGRGSQAFVVTVISGILISLVNIIAMKIIPWALGHMPFTSKSTQICFEIVLGVLVLYANNIMVIPFVHSPYFPRLFSQNEQLTSQAGPFVTIRTFLDVDRDWFHVVGSQLQILMLMTVFAWTFFDFFLLYFTKKWRHRLASSARDQSHALRILTPPEYEFSAAVSHVVNVVSVAVTFATGLPSRIIVGVVALLMRYVLEKYKLIWYSRFPVVLSKMVVWVMYSVLCAGLTVHMVVAIFILGSNELFPKHWNTRIEVIPVEAYKKKHRSSDYSREVYSVFEVFFSRARELGWFLALLLVMLLMLLSLPLMIGMFKKFKKPEKTEKKEISKSNQFFPSEQGTFQENLDSKRVHSHMVNYDFRYKEEHICIYYGWHLFSTFLHELNIKFKAESFIKMDTESAGYKSTSASSFKSKEIEYSEEGNKA